MAESWREFIKGVWRENPVFRLVLGLCPTLAVTTSLAQAFGMGMAVVFVLVCSNTIISLLRKVIPGEVRIPVFIVVIAAFVTVVKLVMAAKFPALKESLGIFLPLIVVNCIILGRAEAFACRNGPWLSFVDGLGMGTGYAAALCLIGALREFFGTGSLAGIPLAAWTGDYTQAIMIIAPGGFLTLGLLLAAFKHWQIGGAR